MSVKIGDLVQAAMPHRSRPLGPWHPWFAWHPVTTFDNRTVFLKTVWRQGCRIYPIIDSPYGARDYHQYSIEDPR